MSDLSHLNSCDVYQVAEEDSGLHGRDVAGWSQWPEEEQSLIEALGLD